MSISPYKKNIGYCGAVLGILQGLAWTILSLMVVLLYAEAWIPSLPLPSLPNITSIITSSGYGVRLRITLYVAYTQATNKNILLRPDVVLSLSIIYLITSLAWITSSSLIIHALANDNDSKVKMTYKSWSILAIITSIVDFIALILAAIDYTYYVNNYSPGLLNDYVVVAAGIVMTLAARGYALWVVNIIFAVLFMRISNEAEDEVPHNAPALRVSNQNIFSQPATPVGNVNNAYNWEGERPSRYPQERAYPAPQNYGKPEIFPKPMIKPNERLAKIGKPPARSPPHNVPPPTLPSQSSRNIYPRPPSPDYSPPASPYQANLRPALKSRYQNNPYSNNNY